MNKIYLTLIAIISLSFNVSAQAGWSWAKSAGGTGLDGIRDIYTDNSGNSYATGSFAGTTAAFGNITLTNSDASGLNGDIFIAKYDANGDVIWAKSAGGNGNDAGNGITVDANGNVYITGEFKGVANFSGTTLTAPNNNEEIFVAKYNANGDLQWAKRAGGNLRDWGYGIAVDQTGNVYITGNIGNNANFDGTPYPTISGNNNDGYIAKYSTNGDFLWLEQIGGTNPGGQNSTQSANSIAYNPTDNTFSVGGWFYGSVTWGGLGGINDSSSAYPNSGLHSLFVATYDSSGAIQWVSTSDERQVNASSHSEANSLDIDSDGNVYLTGSVAGRLVFTSTDSIEMMHTNSWDFDAFLVKYNANGAFQWVRQIGGGDGDEARDLAIDSQDNILITGSYSEAQTVGSFNLPAATNGLFFARFNGSGDVIWAFGEPTAYLASARALSVDGQGKPYVAGEYTSFTNFGSNIQLTAVDLTDAFIAKYDITTGITTQERYQNITIYPNPAHDFLMLQLPDGVTQAAVYLQDITGKTLISQRYEANQAIRLDELPAGIYTCRVETNDLSFISKLVVH